MMTVPQMIASARTLVKPHWRSLRHKTRIWREMAVRSLTAPIRMMPDFIIIGAQKCGTSSLYYYLTSQHPCIASAWKKEVHFFDVSFRNGLNWYRARFPSICYKHYFHRVHGRKLVTGEASPYYIFYPHAPRRIFETVPQVKLIALLRNPVDRAYSQYQHNVSKGRETLSFEEALAAEPQRLAGEYEKILADGNYLSYRHAYCSYLARGVYVDQLKEWFDVFPKEQLLILNSEEFFSDPAVTFKKVLHFLDVPDRALMNPVRRNTGRYPNKMATATRAQLVEYFRPHNQRLYEFLGTSFDWDK